ncbi:unnamed protein product [Adineta ricciae]|uniref:Uncharacterized protein n=1 Tax=Adineta ricciae TaxID=249248 RepID=A0A813V822_ADIRI|nr:unnamed protein product [Adineta ricciae]
MVIQFLTVFSFLLLVIINIDINHAKSINVVEHVPNDLAVNESNNQSWHTTTEQTLIRITRLDLHVPEPPAIARVRRGSYDPEEIWGMAKTVAISVFVLIAVCIVCCLVTTIYICIKCCCGGGSDRKRNQGFHSVPQPIVIQTSPANYHPQVYQQQAPPSQPTWALENHPMLPQPSAPPQPADDFHMERPPPYEKICGNS